MQNIRLYLTFSYLDSELNAFSWFWVPVRWQQGRRRVSRRRQGVCNANLVLVTCSQHAAPGRVALGDTTSREDVGVWLTPHSWIQSWVGAALGHWEERSGDGNITVWPQDQESSIQKGWTRWSWVGVDDLQWSHPTPTILWNQREERTSRVATSPVYAMIILGTDHEDKGRKSSWVKHTVGTPEKPSPEYWAAIKCTSKLFRHFDTYSAIRLLAEIQLSPKQSRTQATYILSALMRCCPLLTGRRSAKIFFSGAWWFGNTKSLFSEMMYSNSCSLNGGDNNPCFSLQVQPSHSPLCMACGWKKLLHLKQGLEGSLL